MIRTLTVVLFGLALASAAQAMPLVGEDLHRWVVERFLSRLAFDRLNTNGASVKGSKIFDRSSAQSALSAPPSLTEPMHTGSRRGPCGQGRHHIDGTERRFPRGLRIKAA